jgi:hypothetical protein
MESRRRFLLGTTAIVAASATLAACGTTPTDVVATVAQIIEKIQRGVADACSAAGKFVPTAQSVIAVLASVIGVVFVGVSDIVKIAEAAVLQVISIIAEACKSAPQPASRNLKLTAKGAKGENLNVEFY